MAKPPPAASRHRCVHPSMVASRTVSLPVVREDANGKVERTAANTIRPSRSGKRRAIVLAAVQGVIIAHIALWVLSQRYGWFAGQTTTPIEPSESMEFVKHGLVNAGLIFFSIALLSTLVLGRWFCGWGCHIVMLQDFCGWLMKKVGIRPRPFRSRFLIYVPLLLALYMFIWPAVFRWGVLPLWAWIASRSDAIAAPAGMVPWAFQAQLTTADFWRTFPGVFIAIPFLLVCGFATVYFLGAKGFCTYGCPYGGLFAPLDKFAPGRIRVTDACEQCGHCTAVCTSNVRVHDEVREYGMVIDPGCMKCLDCVSVCPNDALYFGFGKPSLVKGSAKNQPPPRKYDLTLGEELLCAAVFAITFFSTRGVYGLVPMLMAAGLAGCVTFMTWKLVRLLREASVTLHRFQFKLRGRVSRSGWLFTAITILTLALVLHSGVVNAAHALGGWHDDRVTVRPEIIFGADRGSVDADTLAHAGAALKCYQLCSAIGSGGIGLTALSQNEIDIRMAWLHCVRGEFGAAETLMRKAFARTPTEGSAAALAMILRSSGEQAKAREALDLYERLLPEHPEYALMLNDYEGWAASLGRFDQIVAVHRARLQRDPRNVPSLRSMSMILLQQNNLDEGLSMVKRWVDNDPRNPDAHRLRALALADARQMDQAIDEMRTAVKLAPDDPLPRSLLADMLDAVGRRQDAAAVRAGH